MVLIMSLKVLPARKQCPRCELIFEISRYRCPRCNYPHQDKRKPITKKEIADFRKWSINHPELWDESLNERWDVFRQTKKD